MKNKLILGAAFLLAAITEILACTNLIVGKGASVDGSVIVSYSADSYGMFGELYHYPAGMHEKMCIRDRPSALTTSLTTDFRRSSNSPLYLAPATSAPISLSLIHIFTGWNWISFKIAFTILPSMFKSTT